jgi:hypothetical protein
VCDLGVVVNETSIEVAKAEEWLDFFNLGGVWPFRDALYLSGVHVYISCRDNNFKVFDSSLIKGAFLWLEVKIVFREAS